MPEYLAPGVFVEEVAFRAAAIGSVAAPVTVFVGPTALGRSAVLSPAIDSFAAFRRHYGGLGALRVGGGARLVNHVAHAARCFFQQGGRRLHVVRVAGGNGRAPSLRGYRAALAAIAGIDGLYVLAAPGSAALPGLADDVRRALVERVAGDSPRGLALLDPDPGLDPAAVSRLAAGVDCADAVLYYPWISVRSPTTGRDLALPPCGAVAGILDTLYRAEGPHRAPANHVVASANGVQRVLSAAQAQQLNAAGVNAIRSFPSRGIRVWGARTLSSDPEWRYLALRRYSAFLRQSIDRGTQWAVFEPNGAPLWAALRAAVADFLDGQWRSGRLQGRKANEAYFVRCDDTTMTRSDRRAGRLVIEAGFAPLRPAEFVVLRIVQQRR